MARYLTDLADVLRAAGLTVIEVDGWKTRARSSGGYADGRPTHLMIHHTASPPHTDGQRDVDYIVAESAVKPIANIYTDRKGVVWVCAAGATNTNGEGRDTWGGGVPDNAMNLYAISNEIANTGTGEPYPAEQQQSVLTSSAAICRAYSIPVDHARGHFEWTSRKIDPSGPSMWAASGKWAMDEFRDDVAATINPPPIDQPEGEPIAMNGIVAIYQPVPELVAAGMNKTFGLLPLGDVRHLSGPDAELDRPTIPIRGAEHYQQCEALDAVWRNRRG